MDILDKPNKLTVIQQNFFKSFRKYIEQPLYFIGSIHRIDYFPGKSDLDIEVFTDNENSLLHKIITFLEIEEFIPRILVFESHDKLISSYKITYNKKLSTDIIKFDLLIYNIASKSCVIKDKLTDIRQPMIIVLILLIIKFLYYYTYLIDHSFYIWIKEQFMIINNPVKTITKPYNYDNYLELYKLAYDKNYLVKPIYLHTNTYKYT